MVDISYDGAVSVFLDLDWDAVVDLREVLVNLETLSRSKPFYSGHELNWSYDQAVAAQPVYQRCKFKVWIEQLMHLRISLFGAEVAYNTGVVLRSFNARSRRGLCNTDLGPRGFGVSCILFGNVVPHSVFLVAQTLKVKYNMKD